MQQSLLEKLVPATGEKRIITIDGPAGSGKTMLAAELAIKIRKAGYSVETIHMDDIYNGWTRALSEDLASALLSITDGYHRGEVIYEIYDWSENRYSKSKSFPSPEVLILEGVGSGQRAIRERSHLKIWIEVEPDIAFNRVIARDGEAIRNFMEQWVLEQSAHFLREETKGAADYLLNGAP